MLQPEGFSGGGDGTEAWTSAAGLSTTSDEVSRESRAGGGRAGRDRNPRPAASQAEATKSGSVEGVWEPASGSTVTASAWPGSYPVVSPQ